MGVEEVVYTQRSVTDPGAPGPRQRDLEVDLLSLVAAGCTVEEIVQELGLGLGDVYKELVKLRLVIEDVSRAPASH